MTNQPMDNHHSIRLSWYLPWLTGVLVMTGSSMVLAQGEPDDEAGVDVDSSPSLADRITEDFIKGSTVDGRFGVYDFRRFHDSNQPYPLKDGSHKQDSSRHRSATTAFGAQIGLETGRLYGFSLAGEGVVTIPTQSKNGGRRNLNANLADETILNNTKAYLQYHGYGVQIRGGRQSIDTPMAGPDQFSFLPRSFQGVSGIWRPLETMAIVDDDDNSEGNGTQSDNYEMDAEMPFDIDADQSARPEWQIFAAGISQYQARASAEHFHRNNRYFDDANGFWTVGTSFQNAGDFGQVIAQYYHYHFMQTQSSDYAEAGYMAPTMETGDTRWAPYVRAQIQAAYNANKERIPDGINSQIYGLKFGVNTEQLDFSIFGNYSPEHNGSFNSGQMLHPYTDLSGVLYSDTMNDGIDELGPGWSIGARLDYEPNDDLTLYGQYVQYHARHGHYHDFLYDGGYGTIDSSSFNGAEVRNQKSEGIDVGLTYDMGGLWKPLEGLKVQDEVGFTRFYGDHDHKKAPNFIDNRARIYYKF